MKQINLISIKANKGIDVECDDYITYMLDYPGDNYRKYPVTILRKDDKFYLFPSDNDLTEIMV